jgi:hypothetical protein
MLDGAGARVIRLLFASSMFLGVPTLAACGTVDTECHSACQQSNSCSPANGLLQCDSTCSAIDQQASVTGCGSEIEDWLDCVTQNVCNTANQEACAPSLNARNTCVDAFCAKNATLPACANR